MATTYLTRTTGTPTNAKKCTFSAWVKRSLVDSGNQWLISEYTDSSNRTYIGFTNTDNFTIAVKDGGSWVYEVKWNAANYRDTSGWYNVCIAIDSTESVSTDRIKAYINGVAIPGGTSPSNYPGLNDDIRLNTASKSMQIGAENGGSIFSGLMSFVSFCDGTAYAPTVFGSTDATSGEWVINTSPSVTYGTNGFLVMKNGNTITDQSSNSNDFTLAAGTLTDLQDCPDDVFATWNPLANQTVAGGTFTTGNNTWQSGNSYYSYMPTTIGVAKGKFYWEVKVSAKTGASEWHLLGISSAQPSNLNDYLGELQYDYSYYANDGYKYTNASGTAFGDAYAVGDIISVALDVDNLKVYFAKNGTWQNSGDPTSGATGTGSAYTIENPTNTLQGCYFPSACYYDDNTNGTYQANFGNGYFGTTAISSEGTNASNIGKFEYDVPTGYTALSTKGLNE